MGRLVLVLGMFMVQSAFGFIATVEDVTQFEILEPACDVCEGGSMVIYTTFDFTVTSCRGVTAEEFQVEVEKRRVGISDLEETFVEVKHVNISIDCTGPTSTQKLNLQTTDLKKGERYILRNPSVLKPRSANPFGL